MKLFRAIRKFFAEVAIDWHQECMDWYMDCIHNSGDEDEQKYWCELWTKHAHKQEKYIAILEKYM